MLARSEPIPGSVIAIAVTSSPDAIPGIHRAPLLLGAVREEVGHADVVVQAQAEPGPADARELDLLVDHLVVPEVVGAAAAVLLGEVHPDEAVPARLGEEVVRDDPRSLPLEVVRNDLLVEPRAEARAQLVVLGLEQLSSHGPPRIGAQAVQAFSFSTISAGSGPIGMTFNTVTPASRYAARRSLMYPSGPTRLVSSSSSDGHRRLGLALLARQVQVLDLGRLGLVAVALHERVVEVPAARAHAADVERRRRPGEVADVRDLGLLPDRDQAAGADLERPERGRHASPHRRRAPDRTPHAPSPARRRAAASRRRSPP